VTILIGRELLNEKNFRILVAVDGSAASENAVETLASHFRLTGAEITLMHVIERPWLRLDLEAPQTDEPELEELFGGELRTEAEAIVEAARARLSGRSASTESLVVDGNPGVEILRQAEVGEYDLAVLGATGASDLKHTVLGSVSFKLGSNAPCSVAVVR
jgi:nucleotide-binding universal stress UspA family protein